MREIPHAEMEKWHYQALKNPRYQMEGMMDVMREEMSMTMPLLDREEPTPVYKDTEWTNQQWGVIEQLKSELVGWRQKHAEALKEIDSLRALVSRKKHTLYK